jgi:hypothetical protein
MVGKKEKNEFFCSFFFYRPDKLYTTAEQETGVDCGKKVGHFLRGAIVLSDVALNDAERVHNTVHCEAYELCLLKRR